MTKTEFEEELKYTKEFANLYLKRYEKLKSKLLELTKEESKEVDFSILNENDVFYCELKESKWLFISNAFHYPNNGCLMLRIDVIDKNEDGWLAEKREVKKLIQATEEQKEFFTSIFRNRLRLSII